MTNKEKSEKIQKMFLENYDSIRKTIGGDSYTDIRDAHKLHLECVLKVLFPEDEEKELKEGERIYEILGQSERWSAYFLKAVAHDISKEQKIENDG